MNHTSRAKGAVARVLAPHLHKSDLFELLTEEFARVLRKAEREAHRAAIYEAANYVGDRLSGVVDDLHRRLIVGEIVELARRRR